MSILRTFICLALAAAAASAHGATFHVGTGSGCTHATIQSAIDAAAADPDVADFVRVTRSVTSYDDIHLDIHDQHLVIEGGYANCQSETADDTRTVLNGNGDDSVIRIHGDGDVVLRKLTLTGGHQPLFDYGYGGGVQISGGPHLVSLDHTFVTGNEAGHGGGISVSNDVNGDPGFVQLVLGDDVVISFNRAEFAPGTGSGMQGGGIYCRESTITWNGGGQTSILSNTASLDGGGIGAEECDLVIAPHGTYGSFNGLVLNEAGRDGGGLAVAGHSSGRTKFYVADANRPVYVSGNSAEREGGGIKINTGAQVLAWDLIVDGNRSFAEGGGVSISDGGSDDFTELWMFGAPAGSTVPAPAGAVSCAAQLRCNSLSDNIARDDSDTPQAAAALRVRADPSFLADFANAFARLKGTRVAGNSGRNVIRVIEQPDLADIGDASASLYDVAIVGNDVSEAVLQTGVSPTNDDTDAFVLYQTTIAGNLIGGSAVIASHHAIGLRNSIVWQPGKQVLNLSEGTPDADAILYVLASDLVGFPPSATNFVADPRFMDPENGDFHLHTSSPAIDYVPGDEGTDADDQPRSVNLALVPDDGFGPQDLGAYERQSIGNLVRNAEFDEDLHLWSNAAPAATSWHAYDHAGSASSGSLQVYDLSASTRVVGLSQCVGIPGPGVYRLGGYGWSWEDLYPPVPDHPIIGWVLRPDSADCAGVATDTGEAAAPTAGGWQPVPLQYIVVDAAEWTPNTTVEVQLIQEKTDNPLGGASDAVLFDGVVLMPDSDRIFADGFDGA